MTAPERPEKQESFLSYLPSLWRVTSIVFSLSKAAILFKVIGAMLDATLPIATSYLAGRTTTALASAFTGVPEARTEAVILVAATTSIALAWTGWRSLNRYVEHLISYKVENTVADMMLEKFLSLDFWRYDDKETVELKERADRFSRFFTYIFNSLFSTVGGILSLIVAGIALLTVSPLVTLIVFAAMVPAAFIETKKAGIRMKRWNDMAETRRLKWAVDWSLTSPSSITETRMYGLVPHFIKEVKRLRTIEQGSETVFERRSIVWDFLADIIQNAALLFGLIWTVLKIAAHAQPIGQFIYVQALISRSLGSLNSIISELGRATEDLANLKDYDEFINLPEAEAGAEPIPSGIPGIELKELSFSYPNSERQVLTDISLSIPAGSHLAIVGENGAGKSTLIKILLGLYRPTGGTIEIDGKNLETYDIGNWHSKIGILFQDFQEFTFASVRDNVWFGRIGKKPTPESVRTALDRARLADFVDTLPQRVDTITSTRYGPKGKGTQLSGGQWQRLAIARNFFRDADILILDEPTSAVDAKAEAEIFEELNKETAGKTLVIVSHRFSTVRKADRIVVLHEGRIVEQGTHQELMKLGGRYHELFTLQAKEYVS